MAMSALGRYRVLDLTDERGWLCGKVLADLGADVIKVEPPGGDPGRRREPFAAGNAASAHTAPEPDPDANISWWFQCRGKRSVELDLEDPAGRHALLGLVEGADILVESSDPGWLEARDLGPAQLLARNPQLVVTSITAFGRAGPKAQWAASDLVIAAESGLMWLTGEPDRAPVRVSIPQFFRHASVEAAVNTLIALMHAQRTGEGQHVDVSAQCAGIRTLMNAQAFHVLEGRQLSRMGPYSSHSQARFRFMIPCADGHVTAVPVGGALGAPMMRYLFNWAEREGVADPTVKDRDFATTDFSQEPREFYDAVNRTLEDLFARHTKAELYQAALDHGLLVAPVNTVADLRTDVQLADRGYFVPVASGRDGTAAHHQAGTWARLSATPLAPITRAPWVGEHTEAVLAEGPRRPAEISIATMPATGRPPTAPFAGLKVLDLSWVGVGPMTAGYLAAYGATVVKLESTRRPDVLRLTPPFKGGIPGLNNSHFFGDFNAGKLGLGLNLASPEGREGAWRLVEWADVILESFTPKALANWGMDYAEMCKRNPSVVLLSTCMQGQTGPRRLYRGFGNLMASLAGYYELTGWPDRDPALIYGAYTDFIAQRFAALAVVAAMDHRRRTGEGQHIDLSQFEAALQLLGPELLEYEIHGTVARRNGNRDHHRAPHGAYRCRPTDGREEAWVAIACEDDTQWEALRAATDLPDEPTWRTVEGRKADEDRLDKLIENWTSGRTAADVVGALQPRVACGPVATVPDLHADPQVRHRGYWIDLDHPVYGPTPYSGMQAILSRTPGGWVSPAPCLGEHSFEVLTEFGGIDPDDVARLLADDVVEITGG
jgi:crotonobetainyl-CoA:carnitine CoA-transferase CaiB-like acyl-CoA transferase